MIVQKLFRFEASHRLPKHRGKCHTLHGHSWRVNVSVSGSLNHQGFVVDFTDLKKLVAPVIDFMDHKHLNWLMVDPTSERMALLLQTVLQPLNVDIAVSETETSWAYSYSSQADPMDRDYLKYLPMHYFQLSGIEKDAFERGILWGEGAGIEEGRFYHNLLKSWVAVLDEARSNAICLAVDMQSNTPLADQAPDTKAGQKTEDTK